jgi:tetratricopeptide (TPR) repeat protein
MVSTKLIDNNIPAIEVKLKKVGGDMVKIEYLENCLRQILPNDVKRFCHARLAELYQSRLMYSGAAKNYDLAAEAATTYKDKLDLYFKQMQMLIRMGDYLMIDKPFKKAFAASSSNSEKEVVKEFLKKALYSQAQEYEKKTNNRKAAEIYERIMELSFIKDEERKQILQKLAQLNSKLGRIKQAIDYERMKDNPPPKSSRKTDDGLEVRRVSFEDLGINWD